MNKKHTYTTIEEKRETIRKAQRRYYEKLKKDPVRYAKYLKKRRKI